MLPLTLNATINYLSDAEYKKLSKTERQQYWQNLENEMSSLQQRKAKADADFAQNNTDIEVYKQRLTSVNSEIDSLYQKLGISDTNLNDLCSKIQYYKDQVSNWEKMSDSQLWENAKAFKELNNNYDQTKQVKIAKLPEFRREFSDLDRRFAAINNSMQDVKVKADQSAEKTQSAQGESGEDSYQVVKGDYLSKIAAYDHIYGDSRKWGVIYRANRDQIKDPNLIQTGMELKIPRGLPSSWKVYKGESLWKIAAYPEVYGKGSKWTIIYRANKDQIKDPDIIHPDQVFSIPRD